MSNFKKIISAFLLFVLSQTLFAQTESECFERVKEGVTELNNKNHIRSLEILTEVKTEAEENNWSKELFLALNNIGANYHMMLDYGEALHYYMKAYEVALNNSNPEFEMIVLNNVAILYSKERSFDKAEEYFKIAFDIAEKKKDSLKIGMYSGNLAATAYEKKEIDKTDFYLDTAFKYAKENSKIYYQAKTIQAQNLFLKGEYDQSVAIIDEILSKLNIPEYSEFRISAYILMSSVYEKKLDMTKATEYLNLVLTDTHSSIENKIDAYTNLIKIYRESGDNLSALTYQDSLLTAKDSLYSVKNGRMFESNRIKFEIKKYQDELIESKNKLKSERILFYSLFGGIFLLLILMFWSLRNYFIRVKQSRLISEKNQKITDLKLEKEKADKILLEKKLNEQTAVAKADKMKLKKELEAKNRQLASKALTIQTRNDIIEDIIKAVSDTSEKSQRDILKNKISDLKNYLKNQSSWDEFFNHFDDVNHGFLASLKKRHPNLTANDVRYLSYVYMNLTTKEISSLLNITPESCRKRKERIIKKMNLKEEFDLYDYLFSI